MTDAEAHATIQADMFTQVNVTEGEVDRVAIHEAAHAVLLLATGGALEEVRMERGREAVPLDAVKGCGWSAVSLLAGIAAERVAGFTSVHPADLQAGVRKAYGWEGDLDRFTALRCRNRVRPLRVELSAAETMVREHWPAIQVVAAALRSTGRLNSEEVRTLTEGAEA